VDGPPRDAIIIGAGFSGLYALYKLRQLGFSARVLEMGDGVGGTWYWNRYPGARCDLESIEYSYSFSDEIQQEWVWNDTMPPQDEIEAYLNYVADKLDLRKDIQFDTKVTAMTFDDESCTWRIETETAETFEARFVIAATGLLSAPLDPAIAGRESFAGISLFTNRFPQGGFDFTGKRVAIVGTGSTGVQATPVVAGQAAHLYVFQRSAAYTLPSNCRPFEPGELDALKGRYPEIRAAQKDAAAGATRTAAFNAMALAASRPPIKTASREVQVAAVDEFGRAGALFWSDVLTDIEASRMATGLYAEAIARIVKDPDTAASLVPNYPFGCKRPIIDQGFYEAFNRDNVTLVDLRKGGIQAVTPGGIQTEQGFFELDVILYATGFDAMTGALSRIDIRGRNGSTLRDVWASEGAVSYLGLMVAGFPNLFTVIGPGSPGALANVAFHLELHVDWVGECLVYLRDHGNRMIEARPEPQQEWTEHVNSLVQGTVMTHPSCNSWWIGANVPGKKRMYMSYAGGLPEYRRRCNEIAAAGYQGFRLV
jgi:cation diffusion facilitator CzcD-associated flavoprotein CzcO